MQLVGCTKGFSRRVDFRMGRNIPWWLSDKEIVKMDKWNREKMLIYREALERPEWKDPDQVEKTLKPGEKICDECEGYGYMHPGSDGTMHQCKVCKGAGKI